MTRSGRLLQAVNWKYAVGELVLIIAGILIALSASAWWQGREHHTREAAYLRELRGDLDATLVMLDSAMARDSMSIDRTTRALGLLRSSDESLPSQDSVPIWLSFAYAPFQPVTATMTTLIESGDLRLIRDDDLRRAIVGFAAIVSNANDQLLLMDAVFHEQTSIARTRLEAHTVWRGVWADTSSQQPRTYDLPAMRRDSDLRGACVNTRLMQRSHLNRLRRVRQAADRLRSALAAPRAQ